MTSPALSERLQAALGSGYRIERELGGGGMSRVFVAEETAFGRQVVIKVLPPELAAAVNVERFRREIQLAAQLQHPNIIPLHAAGIADDLPYFTMPFVTGETLRARIARSGELPVNDTVKILRDVLTALSYAHEKGVVHRDIKPDNVMLTKHHALVADFGVAKAISASGASGGSVTSVGIALGTPAYMAPEQAAADPSVDHRADLYAVGALAYEMLTGYKVFGDRTPQQMLAAHAIETPDPIQRPAVPPELAQLVMRALEKHPADRAQTAEEMLATLDGIGVPSGAGAPLKRTGWARPRANLATPGKLRPWILLGGAAAGVVSERPARLQPGRWHRQSLSRMAGVSLLIMLAGAGALLAWWRTRSNGLPAVAEAGPAAKGRIRLAVLPFENLGDTSTAYIVDGITDEVRSKLTSLAGLQVIARSSSNEYKQTKKPLAQIARELGVQYLLTGTMRAVTGTRDRIRVMPELVELRPGAAPMSRWGQPFEVNLADIFQVQSEIASRVAGSLQVALASEERSQLSERPTENLAAYEAYLRGEETSNALAADDPQTLRGAIRFYERAVALDSTFASAWARLAQTQVHLYAAFPGAKIETSARRAAERAIALAPGRPEGHVALGTFYVAVAHEPRQAAEHLDAALRVAPDHADILTARARLDFALGRWEQARERLQRAAMIDPRSALTAQILGQALLWLRRYPQAGEALERALALHPENVTTLQYRSMVEIARGDLPSARAVLRSAPATVERTALAVQMGVAWDVGWALDDASQRLLLGSGPEAFHDDRLSWALVHAQLYAYRGDHARSRAYADSARLAAEELLRDAPEDGQLHTLLGIALAYIGRGDEAVHEGKRGVALLPLSKDVYYGAYIQHQLARIYILVGEHEKALDILEPLLKLPYYLSPRWLRIDPTFAPLRGNPRFERLAGRS